MIINEKETEARLNSPINLINKLKSNGSRKSAMSLFIRPSFAKAEEKIIEPRVDVKVEEKKEELKALVTFNPFETAKQFTTEAKPTIDDLIENNETQVRLAHAHDQALELLNNSVALLSTKLEDVKADKLPSVISAASKVVEGIRKERRELNESSDREVHYHFYTPEQRKVSEYKVIDV